MAHRYSVATQRPTTHAHAHIIFSTTPHALIRGRRHFAFWDYLFGTAVKTDRNKIWPDNYGVVGGYVPEGFWRQQLYPLTWSGRWTDEHGVAHRENR